MDKELKKLIAESIDEFFEKAPLKFIKTGIRDEKYDVCPHCNKEIFEKHEYTDDGGLTWRHSDCKGLIERPEQSLDGVATWLKPYAEKARKERKEKRKLAGIKDPVSEMDLPDSNGEAGSGEDVNKELPLSGEDKYLKNDTAPVMNAVNLDESNSEKTESKDINIRDSVSFFNGSCIVQNPSQVKINVTCTQFLVSSANSSATSYVIKINIL